MWEKIINKNVFRILRIIFREVFYVTLVTYFIFYFIETLNKGFVSNFVPLNYVLNLGFVSGILTVIFPLVEEEKDSEEKDSRISRSNIIFVVIIGLICAFFVWYRSRELGWFSYLVSIVSALFVVLFTFLMLSNDETN